MDDAGNSTDDQSVAPSPDSRPAPPADPAEEPVAEAEPAATEPDPEALKARPRPWAGAPVVYEQPSVSLDKVPAGSPKADPIADFFARKDDDGGRRWFGRKRGKSEEADAADNSAPVAQTKPDKAPARSEDTSAEGRDHHAWGKAVRRTVRFVIVVAIAVVAALLLRTFVVQPYYVPSESMEPTLHGCKGCNDDHVLVEKLSYRFHDVKAGDIVVFHRPSTWPASQVPDGVLIKRVVAVAGDRLTLKHGRVFRNGQPLEEPYVNQKCKQGTTDKNGSTRKKSYPRVPNGQVFVMGDNRCDSEDSRFFGDVPTSDIIGRAFLIIWPVGRIHSLN